MSEKTVFTYTILSEDIKAYFDFTLWFKQKLLIPVLIFSCGVGLALLAGGGWRLWAGLALLSLAAVYVVRRLRLWPRFEQAARGETGQDYALTVSAFGLSASLAGGEERTRVRWDKVLDIRETRRHFFIYSGPFTAMIVPRRDLADADTVELRRLLRAYGGSKYNRF